MKTRVYIQQSSRFLLGVCAIVLCNIADSAELEWDCGVYQGQLEQGVPQGEGTLTCDDFTYKGEFLDGARTGTGIIDLSLIHI